MSSNANAATTLTVDNALDNMTITLNQEAACVSCGKQVAPDSLRNVCVTRCKDASLALPGCVCCTTCMRSKLHHGDDEVACGLW
jgi:hypothetical protein